MYFDVFSNDTSQNIDLKLEIQATIEPNIINKDIMNRGQIATSSFPHGMLWAKHLRWSVLQKQLTTFSR